jgi:hypothetical protein
MVARKTKIKNTKILLSALKSRLAKKFLILSSIFVVTKLKNK